MRPWAHGIIGMTPMESRARATTAKKLGPVGSGMPANITMNPTAASLRSAAAGYRARSPDLERAAVAA